MSTSRDVFQESSVGISHTPFAYGGYFIGSSTGSTMKVSGLEPAQTYYFCSRYRIFSVPPTTYGDNVTSFGPDTGTFSEWSNIVEFTPSGSNAVQVDRNYSDMVQYNRFGDLGSWHESIQTSSNASENERPPAGWQMVKGAWTFDFERELTTVNTGIAAIKSPESKTTTAAIETELFPAPASGLVRAISTMRTDDTGARFTMKLHEYQADKSTQNGSGTELLANGQAYLQTADEWIEASKGILLANTTKWCKFKFLRSNNTGNVYINDARLVNGIITFRASATTAASAQVINAGATDTILFNDESTNPNHNVHQKYVRATGIYTIIRDGIYEFSSQVSVTLSAADSSHFSDIDSFIQILAGGAVSAINYGEAISTTKAQFKITTGPVSLKKDDEVKVQIINGSAKDMTVVNTVGYSYFNGKEID
jgi:hypothetical protein